VQAAEGYRNGGFNTTFLAVHPADPQTYGGDELNSYEAGLRWTGRDDRMAELAVSRTFWHNVQSDQLQASGLPIAVNVGNADIANLEARGRWPAARGVEVEASAQWTAPSLKGPGGDARASDDAGLPFVSGFSGHVGASLVRRVWAVPLRASADLSYATPSHLNFGRLDDVTMNGFSRLDLLAAVPAGAGRLTVRLDNALGVRGNSFAYGNPFSLAHKVQVTPLRPRTLWLTWRFGG